MIEDGWRRIAGLYCKDSGEISAVWVAWDPDTDVAHIYDCCHFRREVPAVIAEGLNARGRNVPIAWAQKEVADKMLDRGCNMLPESADDSAAMAELISRDIWARMRSGRFKVDRRQAEWLDEYKTFNRDGAKVPRDSHPLMTATRYAIGSLAYARSQRETKKTRRNYKKVSIV